MQTITCRYRRAADAGRVNVCEGKLTYALAAKAPGLPFVAARETIGVAW